jgi:hypothetical protein
MLNNPSFVDHSLSLIILFGTTTTPSFISQIVYLFLLKCSMLLSPCTVSLGWTEGLRHYPSILKDWGDLCIRENSTYIFSRPRISAVSTRLPNVVAPKRELGDIVTTISLYAQISAGAPTRTKFQRFLSSPPLSLFKNLLVSTQLQ